MDAVSGHEPRLWKLSVAAWASIAVAAVLLATVFHTGLAVMAQWWFSPAHAEYSYGPLIPLIALFLVWQRSDRLARLPFDGSWAGVAVVLLGALLYAAGQLSALYILVQYAFLVVLAGVTLAFMGPRAFRVIGIPVLILGLMIPLPNFLYNNLSEQLELLSSRLGVDFIRAFGDSVYLAGNVIDLGSLKLQVVDACSGLRYLFPLMTLGFVAAYLFQAPFWKRALVFASTVPMTVLMNSFRIGLVGVTVDWWGRAMAEGFLHLFEGWVIFMICTALLVGEMWVMARMGKDRRHLAEVFGLEGPRSDRVRRAHVRRLPTSYLVALGLLALVALATTVLPKRAEVTPKRKDFSTFPMRLPGWQGRGGQLDDIYIKQLKFTDYLLANYIGAARKPVNFYVAYYASQRKGASAHSPRTCIPGGGWEITSLTQRDVRGVRVNGHPLRVNRLVIAKGNVKDLVYYWFQERGRIITNEYLAKWYLLWDALRRNRTDGALVRLTTELSPGEAPSHADRILSSFARAAVPRLTSYIPN
ncbi:MAG: VPLPA-CTERM-specific exosortase XrtD [Betaproteobacteria bacterium]|nr:VPLPA-CTERM-specific exosortase XrtD [Betaproteobacteria bacterium]